MFIVCYHRTVCLHMHSGATTAYPYGYRASVRSVVSRLTAPCPLSRARPPRLRRAVPSLRYKKAGHKWRRGEPPNVFAPKGVLRGTSWAEPAEKPSKRV